MASRRAAWGGWNNELRIDAHPQAHQALVLLAGAADEYIARARKTKKTERKTESRRNFVNWLKKNRKMRR